MPEKKLNHYNPTFTYKKEDVTIDKTNKNSYPTPESVNNGTLYPEGIKNSIDMDQFKPLD